MLYKIKIRVKLSQIRDNPDKIEVVILNHLREKKKEITVLVLNLD